jgi:hypothetical protein
VDLGFEHDRKIEVSTKLIGTGLAIDDSQLGRTSNEFIFSVTD